MRFQTARKPSRAPRLLAKRRASSLQALWSPYDYGLQPSKSTDLRSKILAYVLKLASQLLQSGLSLGRVLSAPTLW